MLPNERRTVAQDRVHEVVGAEMDRELETGAGAVWALGDYPKVAREVLGDLGDELVAACGIGPGQRVLDVAAGSGNVALRAARAGAAVVAVDITPALLEAGRREASARGLELDWVEADAEALPFADGAFDVVTSCVGAMFAPDHRATAAELLRVCRAGGTIGMINWTPEGAVGEFFEVFAPYAPPPPGAVPPVAWGGEEHLRGLFGDRVDWLRLERAGLVVDHFASPGDWCDYYKRNFGPTIAAYAAAGPDHVAALDRDFLQFATRWNRGGPGGPARFELEYLLAVARKSHAVASR
jgi:SAM-dependent methyltransferase